MAGKGCPMCAALGKGDNDFWVSVFTGEVAEVHLERRSRLPGYCIVVWRHGHVAEPGDLDPLQAGRYWAEVLATGRAVRARFNPVKLNYMTLGNTVPHVQLMSCPGTRTIQPRAGRSPGRRSSPLTRCRRPSCTARPQLSAAWRIPDLERIGALPAAAWVQARVVSRSCDAAGLRGRRCRTRADAA